MKNKDRNNVHLNILATRLREVREEKGIKQFELAKKVNDRGIVKITTEKINYCELNIEGRKLQIEELAEIAEVLNVSTDYLLGRTESKNNKSNNGLSDLTNETIALWGNDTLGVVDMLIQQYNDSGIVTELKTYLFVTYVTTNILKDTIESIEDKVNRNIDITHLETQKIAFLKEYIKYFEYQKTQFYHMVAVLSDRHRSKFESAIAECDKILKYNNDRSVQINFAKLITINIPFELFRNHLKPELQKRMDITLDDMVEKTRTDNKYFNKIKKFFNEVNH